MKGCVQVEEVMYMLMRASLIRSTDGAPVILLFWEDETHKCVQNVKSCTWKDADLDSPPNLSSSCPHSRSFPVLEWRLDPIPLCREGYINGLRRVGTITRTTPLRFPACLTMFHTWPLLLRNILAMIAPPILTISSPALSALAK
jgi:hypothetical protein